MRKELDLIPIKDIENEQIELRESKDELRVPVKFIDRPKKIVLANFDYQNHMTDEGDQLQEGLASVGWTLVGRSYRNHDYVDVNEILSRYKPDIVFVQDKRDWDRDNTGAFNKTVHFENINTLRHNPHIFRVSVVKDAGTLIEYQRKFIKDDISADAVAVYYHPKSVLAHSSFLEGTPLFRVYHSIDKDKIKCTSERLKGTLISGALNPDVYPFRSRIVNNASSLGVDILGHPGYNNNGRQSDAYYHTLNQYKVSICTASAYNFALRKIIESVACGCVCITNLPRYDILPQIDGALIRVSPDIPLSELQTLIRHTESNYDFEKAQMYSEKAREFYDYRIQANSLYENIIIEWRKKWNR